MMIYLMKGKKLDSFGNDCTDNSGFTLVELMITLVISGIIAGALYSTYLVQQHSYTNQEAVAEMQQNIRAALMVMSRDIRMAGYDPVGSGNAGFGTAVASNNIQIIMDLNGDGDTNDVNENLNYYLYINGGIRKLGRRDNNNLPVQAVGENFDAIEFQYLNSTGAPLTTPVATPSNIRAVRVSILARASWPDRKFTNTKTYCPASNPWDPSTQQCTNPNPAQATIWGPYNDNYRRRLLITTIQCRNMGL